MNLLFHELLQKTREFTNGMNGVLKQHGIYSSQWTVLFIVEQRGEMSLTSIWKYLNVEAPTITRTVARFEQLGLLQRKKGDDLREKIVSLTEEGKKKFEEVKVTVSAYEDQFAKGLTEEEQEQLKGLLRKMKG